MPSDTHGLGQLGVAHRPPILLFELAADRQGAGAVGAVELARSAGNVLDPPAHRPVAREIEVRVFQLDTEGFEAAGKLRLSDRVHVPARLTDAVFVERVR